MVLLERTHAVGLLILELKDLVDIRVKARNLTFGDEVVAVKVQLSFDGNRAGIGRLLTDVMN